MNRHTNKNIIKKLEDTYKQAAEEYIQQEIMTLTSLANMKTEPLTIYENGTSNLITTVVLLIISIVFLGYFFIQKQVFAVLICIAFATLLIRQFVKIYHCTLKPIFIINEQGIILSIFKHIIPWEEIDHFYISQTHKLVLNFHLKTGFSPSMIKKNTDQITYNLRKNHIQVIMLAYKNDKNLNYYNNLLTNYWSSAIAKVRLKELISHL